MESISVRREIEGVFKGSAFVAIILAAQSISLLTGCGLRAKLEGSAKYSTRTDLSPDADPAPANNFRITDRRPFVVRQGDTVALEGENFQSTMTVTLNGLPVSNLAIESSDRASFRAPAGSNFGLASLNIRQGEVDQTISIFYAGAADEKPIMTRPPSEVCAGEQYYDAQGKLQTGIRICAATQWPECTSEGQLNCRTTRDFAAVPVAGLANKVAEGSRVAGVDGVVPRKPADCAADGQVGCVTVTGFKAADMSRVVPANVRKDITIADVQGDFPSQVFPLDGADSTPDLDLATFDAKIKSSEIFEWFDSAGTRFVRAGDNDIDGANILDGVTIFGTSGTLAAAPDPSDVRYGVSFGTGSTGTMRSTKICKNGAGIGSLGGNRVSPYNGTMTQVQVGGTVAITNTSPTITGTGTNFTNHVGIGDYITVAGETRKITVRSSATSLTVDADFTQTLSSQNYTITPSTNAEMSVDDYQNGGLTAAGSGTVSTSAGTVVVTGSGTIFTTEVAVGDYITVSSQQRTVASITNDTTLTVNVPFTATMSSVTYSLQNYYPVRSECNEDNFQDVTGGTNLVPNSAQEAAWTRVFQDRLTGLYLTNVLSSGRTWSQATDICANLNGGTPTAGIGWRLPSQKELTQLYINGISRMGSSGQSAFGGTYSNFWSSTLYSPTSQNAWNVNLANGYVFHTNRGQSYSYLCVRI